MRARLIHGGAVCSQHFSEWVCFRGFGAYGGKRHIATSGEAAELRLPAGSGVRSLCLLSGRSSRDLLELQSSPIMKIRTSIVAACVAAFCFTPSSAATVIVPVQPVVSVGDPVSGIDGATIAELGPVSANANGEMVFRARIVGTGIDTTNDYVIIAGTPGNLTVKARTGDVSPTGALGATITALANNPVITFAGLVTYSAQDGTTGGEFFLAHCGGNRVTPGSVASWAPGQVVPGTPFVATAGGIGDPDGQDVVVNGDFVAFSADLGQTGVAGDFEGVFVFDSVNVNLRIVAATGQESLAGPFSAPAIGSAFDVVTVSPDGGVIFLGKTNDGTNDLESFFAYDPGTDSLSVLVSTGNRPPATRPGRGYSRFGTYDGFGGTDVTFDSELFITATGQPTPNFEVVLGGVSAARPGKPTTKAQRDRAAAGPPGGTVYSFFSAVFQGALRTAAFQAELFKRPNGINPPADQAVFACPNGKRPVRLFTGGGGIASLGEITIQKPNITPNSPLMIGPGGNQILTPVELSDGKNAIINTVIPKRGRPQSDVLIHDGITVNTGSGEDIVTSFERLLIPLNDGRFVAELELLTSGPGIFIGDPPLKPVPAFQPDLICRIPGTGGDNVYEIKAKVQKYTAATKYNMVTDYGITLENDGTADDTIRLTADRNARFFKWFIAGPPEVEITTNVLSKSGRDFTLKPGERVSLILRTERQNFEVAPKSKKAKITFKAVSQSDKTKVDQQSVEVTYSAP